MNNTLVANQLPATTERSGENHLHFNPDKTWLERDMCAHQDLTTIECSGTPADIRNELPSKAEFLCSFCGVANPDIKPEPRTEEWYQQMQNDLD
jgi:hypothetical protein